MPSTTPRGCNSSAPLSSIAAEKEPTKPEGLWRSRGRHYALPDTNGGDEQYHGARRPDHRRP
eukprot:6275857-Alexandrium_andersonii.AAC.1